MTNNIKFYLICGGKNTVYTGFRTTCGFRHPLGFLEHRVKGGFWIHKVWGVKCRLWKCVYSMMFEKMLLYKYWRAVIKNISSALSVKGAILVHSDISARVCFCYFIKWICVTFSKGKKRGYHKTKKNPLSSEFLTSWLFVQILLSFKPVLVTTLSHWDSAMNKSDKVIPRAFGESIAPPILWDFQSPKFERINFCCFKSPRLC